MIALRNRRKYPSSILIDDEKAIKPFKKQSSQNGDGACECANVVIKWEYEKR
jgi:hypothetical protein